jgi:hypothetical protein
MDAIAHFPHEIHALIGSYVQDSGAVGEALDALAGDAEDWVTMEHGKLVQTSASGIATYRNGRLHSRGDAPAWDVGCWREWFRRGKRHRDGGRPAVIPLVLDAARFTKWFCDGVEYTPTVKLY